jgi:hypothetical protein
MKIRSALLVLAIYLPLAACSQSLAASAKDTAITDPNMVRVKAGLWRHTMTIDGRQGSGEECVAASSLIPPKQSDCSEYDVARTVGGEILFDSVCRNESGLVTSHAVYQGDFNSSFANDVVVDVEKPGQISDRITGHETYKYLGPCPAGMRPEDYSR